MCRCDITGSSVRQFSFFARDPDYINPMASPASASDRGAGVDFGSGIVDQSNIAIVCRVGRAFRPRSWRPPLSRGRCIEAAGLVAAVAEPLRIFEGGKALRSRSPRRHGAHGRCDDVGQDTVGAASCDMSGACRGFLRDVAIQPQRVWAGPDPPCHGPPRAVNNTRPGAKNAWSDLVVLDECYRRGSSQGISRQPSRAARHLMSRMIARR